MRILLAIHNAYTDTTSGAALSMRILMQWLMEAGHEVQVLGTARFDAKPPADLMKHLAEHEIVPVKSPPSKAFLRSVKRVSNLGPGRPTFDFKFSDVPVRMLLTKAPRHTPSDRFESEQFLFLLSEILSKKPRRARYVRRPPRRRGDNAAGACRGRPGGVRAPQLRL